MQLFFFVCPIVKPLNSLAPKWNCSQAKLVARDVETEQLERREKKPQCAKPVLAKRKEMIKICIGFTLATKIFSLDFLVSREFFAIL